MTQSPGSPEGPGSSPDAAGDASTMHTPNADANDTTRSPATSQTTSQAGAQAGSQARILEDLQDAVQRMHVVAQSPRVVVATGTRAQGARAMAWQVLYERSLGASAPLVYRGGGATTLPRALLEGFDTEPTPGAWVVDRLGEAMRNGPVIQVFRADRLPDDVSRALVGVLVFEEDGLSLAGVKALVQELGIS